MIKYGLNKPTARNTVDHFDRFYETDDELIELQGR